MHSEALGASGMSMCVQAPQTRQGSLSRVPWKGLTTARPWRMLCRQSLHSSRAFQVKEGRWHSVSWLAACLEKLMWVWCCLPWPVCLVFGHAHMLLAGSPDYWYCKPHVSPACAGSEDPECCRARMLARVATAVAEADTMAVARELPAAVPLASVMLRCLAIGTSPQCMEHWPGCSTASCRCPACSSCSLSGRSLPLSAVCCI